MLVTSTYCVARLVAARVWRRSLYRDTNLTNAADGFAMAGMLVGGFKTLPDGVWEVVFGAFSVWFVVRGIRFATRHGTGTVDEDHAHSLSHYVSHLTMSGAMLYMFLEASPASASGPAVMSAMGGAGTTSNTTALTLLLTVAPLASAFWHADGMSRDTTVRRAASTALPPRAPALLAGLGDGPDATQAAVALPRLAPRLEMACRIALCIAMSCMLVLMQ